MIKYMYECVIIITDTTVRLEINYVFRSLDLSPKPFVIGISK